MLRRTLVPALATASVVLTGCGGSGGGRTTVDGTGYRTSAPHGWTVAPTLADRAAVHVDRYVAPAGDDPRRENIIITRVRPAASVGRLSIGTVEAGLRSGSARAVGAATPPPGPATELDGDAARTWTIRRRDRGRSIVQRQLVAFHGGVLYTVTVSCLARGDDSAGLLDAVRGHWHWD